MVISKILVPVLSLALFYGCTSPAARKDQTQSPGKVKTDLKGTLKINGAYALSPLIEKMAEEFMAKNPGVLIEVVSEVAGQGIADLIAGKCQIAMISRPLTDEEINSGIREFPVTKDGVAPVVNRNNPSIDKIIGQGLSPDELLQIFTSDIQLLWGEVLSTDSKDKIKVFSRDEGSGASEVWARFLYRKASELKGVKIISDDEMIKNIQDNPLGIGFCNFSYAFDSTGERRKDIQIVPVDLDFDNKIDRAEVPFKNIQEAHRSIWLGFYPDQLCRELTLGTIGKPADNLTAGFIRYVLTEGQSLIERSGFCKLNDVYVQYGLDLLN